MQSQTLQIPSMSHLELSSAFKRCSRAEYAKHSDEVEPVSEFFTNGQGVYFSAKRKGQGIVIHLAATKKGKRRLRRTVNDFVNFLLNEFSWCNMVLATIRHDRQSVVNLANKCGWRYIGETEPTGYSVYARVRE